MILGPTIEVTDLESHYGFLTALFKDHPWYSFERINDEVHQLYDLSNSKQMNFKQSICDKPVRVELEAFIFLDKEDFDFRIAQIELLGGSIRAKVKEFRPNYYSVHGDTPCGWSFGLAYFTV